MRISDWSSDVCSSDLEAAESNLIATQAAPIEPQRLPRQPRKEGAIMADDDECPRITIEPAFQPVNRGKIKMVRRLIEQQQIRLTRQRTANGRSAALTARCGFGQTRKINAKLIRDCLHLMPGRRSEEHTSELQS